MRILLTHRYFWPDTAPYAALLRALGEGLAEGGHEVRVFASRPSYRGAGQAAVRETLGKLGVRRIWVFAENRNNPPLRLLNAAIYCLRLFAHILLTRPDVVSVSTFPPVLAAWSAGIAARLTGARLVYHLQDIHPEVSAISGGRMGRGFLRKLLTWLDNGTLKRAAAIVVLSPDMAATIRARLPGRDLPLHIINNFALPDFGADIPPPAELIRPEGIRRVIFAGNLGRFQNLERLTEGVVAGVEAAGKAELLLLGDGAALPALKARWGDHPKVRFGPFLPFAQAKPLIAGADIGLVSLTPGIISVAYPSKVLTYLGLGVPILALVEPQSALARDLVSAGLGRVPQSDSPQDIAAAVAALLAAPPDPAAITDWYARNASQEHVLNAWRELFAGLARA